MDIIRQRSKDGLCPICKEKITEEHKEDFCLVAYEDTEILICKKHRCLTPGTLITKKERKHRKR